MLAKVVNDHAGKLNLRGDLESFASRLAPTVGRGSGLLGSRLGFGTALTLRLEQAYASRHGNVETADATGHRQVHQVVAMLAGQATHALAFSAHDQDGRAGQVLVIQADFSFTGRTDNPQAALLELCLLYTSPSPRDRQKSRMPSSA